MEPETDASELNERVLPALERGIEGTGATTASRSTDPFTPTLDPMLSLTIGISVATRMTRAGLSRSSVEQTNSHTDNQTDRYIEYKPVAHKN